MPASDYDERTIGAITILREIDECLLNEGARRFMPPALFVAAAIFPCTFSLPFKKGKIAGGRRGAWWIGRSPLPRKREREVANIRWRGVVPSSDQSRRRGLELRVPISECVARLPFA
jgi:hypothetical protein